MRNKNKVVIGMSGGVDSSTSAYLLKEKGFEIVGVTLDHGDGKTISKDFQDASAICEKLGIEYRILNIQEDFRRVVIDDFVEEYSRGMTPSPCVICDERIKMKKLLEVADEVGAYYIATGHYCQVERCEELGATLLKPPADAKKDQTYMLYRLSSDTLERMLFPLYGLEKSEVREIAEKIGLEVHDKKDSQGICFAKEGYIDFLKKELGDRIKEGNFIDNQGNIMGKHMGYQLYTIGQRRGLGLKLPRAYFITDIRPETNEIVLGEYEELNKDRVELVDCCFNISLDKVKELEFIAKPRFSSKGLKGKIVSEEGKIFFQYNEPNPQNAPGQHLVLYYNGYVIGGGKIVF